MTAWMKFLFFSVKVHKSELSFKDYEVSNVSQWKNLLSVSELVAPSPPPPLQNRPLEDVFVMLVTYTHNM